MSNAESPEKLALRRAAELAGGQAAIAEACGYEDRRHVWPWFNTVRSVPGDKCPSIERATGVTCEELRPDLIWARIPDKSWPHPKGRPVLDVSKVAA